MNIKYFVLYVFIILISVKINAQEQPKHKKKWYIDENGKFYTNKHLPVYIRLSHSPDEGAESHLLKSRSLPQYTNPMYFDTEGYNSFRSPSAVDTVSKKTVQPKKEIRFEVYADGVAPNTTIQFSDSKKYVNKTKQIFYGSPLTITLRSKDIMSGVEQIYYSINGENYKEYTSQIHIEEEGNFNLKYYAIDHVGNVENVKERKFSIDLSPPTTLYDVKGEVINGTISPNSEIILSAQDAMSGVNKIMYYVNDDAPQIYTKPISMFQFKSGKLKLKFFSVDNLNNSEDKIFLNENINKGNSEYVVFLDKEGPNSSYQIIGDKHYGKHLFISARSKVELNANDNKTNVSKISYGINTKNKNIIYEEPFGLHYTKNGIYNINFSATDKFGNIGKNKAISVFLDNIKPVSSITMGNATFVYNNSTIITRNTNIHINSTDLGSQVKKIEYSVDKGEFIEGSDFQINEEGKHNIVYKATDNVNNKEENKFINVILDNTAPEIHAVHSMQSLGEELKDGIYYDVYPNNSTLFLAATDAVSGVKKFTYSINGSSEINYIENPIISYKKSFLKEGFYSIKVVVLDKLGNKSEKIIKFISRKNS